MGYYTRHELTIENDDYTVDHEKEISEISGYGNWFDDSIKWYSFEDDMRKYSKLHPKLTFIIDGEGEESGDIWKAYFQNGKMFKTKAIMTFEEFSVEKLS